MSKTSIVIVSPNWTGNILHKCWQLSKAEGCGTSSVCCLWCYAVQTAEQLLRGAPAPVNPFAVPHRHFLSKI